MKKILFFAAAMMMAVPAFATGALSPSVAGDQPLTINAARTLEWHRDDKTYVATGSVTARQGDTQISADKLIAKYCDGTAKKSGAPAIYELVPEGNVVV